VFATRMQTTVAQHPPRGARREQQSEPPITLWIQNEAIEAWDIELTPMEAFHAP